MPNLAAALVGNCGLYLACYELSRRGWNVMPTARNARGIDIVAYDQSATSYLGIQVKSLSANNAVPLGTNLDALLGDYWIIVTKVAIEPTWFIMIPEEVRQLAVKGGTEGNYSYWLNFSQFNKEEFRGKWDRIVCKPLADPTGAFTELHSAADEVAYKDL